MCSGRERCAGICQRKQPEVGRALLCYRSPRRPADLDMACYPRVLLLVGCKFHLKQVSDVVRACKLPYCDVNFMELTLRAVAASVTLAAQIRDLNPVGCLC